MLRKHFTLANIISLLSLVLALYFYFDGKKFKQLVWRASPKILIYNKNQTENNFILLNKDSTVINKNVYAQELSIWNAGNSTVQEEDVRVPISLLFTDSLKLIDYKIINQISPVKNNFKLLKTGENLTLTWKYFDPGDGVKIKHIYSSENNQFPTLEGRLLDSKLMMVERTSHNYVIYIIILVLSSFLIYSRKIVLEAFSTYRRTKKQMDLTTFILLSSSIIILIVVDIIIVLEAYRLYSVTFESPFIF